MSRTVRTPSGGGQTNGIPRLSNEAAVPRDDFRVRVEDEISASLERALRLHKAETIAAAVDRKRSTVYRWQADPRDVPASALRVLASFDPDPEFLARVAGHLLAEIASTALRHEAEGRSVMVFHELTPGRFVR